MSSTEPDIMGIVTHLQWNPHTMPSYSVTIKATVNLEIQKLIQARTKQDAENQALEEAQKIYEQITGFKKMKLSAVTEEVLNRGGNTFVAERRTTYKNPNKPRTIVWEMIAESASASKIQKICKSYMEEHPRAFIRIVNMKTGDEWAFVPQL